jgi:glutathione S-transferase
LVFPNGDIVYDSPKIAEYLDLNYPKNPIKNPDTKLDDLINKYDSAAFPKCYQNSILDAYKVFDKDSAKHFKQTIEQIFSLPWEKIPGDRQANIEIYYNETKSINDHLNKSKFLDGDKPAFHDYALIGRIQTMKVISPRTYTEYIANNPGEAFVNWVNSMEGLFDDFLANRITV